MKTKSKELFKPDVTYCKGIFGNGLKIEDNWKERRERETNMHTRENFGKVKTKEKGHFLYCRK